MNKSIKINQSEMDVVGLTSQLDESMRRFAVRLNWPETTFNQETIKKLKAKLGSNFSGKVGILDRGELTN